MAEDVHPAYCRPRNFRHEQHWLLLRSRSNLLRSRRVPLPSLSRNGSVGKSTDDNDDERKRKIHSNTAQILAVSVKNILMFTCGLMYGLPTIVIPDVHNALANSTLSLTDEEVSWFGSISFITNPIGCLASGVINAAFGQKRCMQALTIPIMLVCCTYYFANSAYILCTAQALSGLIGGLFEAPDVTYVTEIAEPHLRGMLVASSTLTILFGFLVVFFLGSFLYWRTVAAICGGLLIIPLITLFFIPESPQWLLSKNRVQDTLNALCWLRGWTTKDRIQDEYSKLFNEMYPETKAKEKGEEVLAQRNNRFCSFTLENCLKRTFVLPFLLVSFTEFICHFTGVTPLCTYTVNIFNSFGAPVNGYYATAILGLTRLLGSLACTILVHYTGKRPLLFLSLAGLAVLMSSTGLYGYLYLGVEELDNGAHVREAFQGMQRFAWFPMACLMAAPLLGYLCLRVLPWILAAEMYPAEIRSFGAGISGAMGYTLGFITNKTFFNFISALTLPGVFMFYAALAFASLPVFYFILPETEGWSLVEVQEHFAGKRNLIKAGKKKRVKLRQVRSKGIPSSVLEENPLL